MVTLDNVCFQPQDARHPPRQLNFHCARPGIVTILGDNGSGKSTLAQLLAGWYPEFLPGTLSGDATVAGLRPGEQPLVEQAQRVQLVQQSPWLQLSGCTFSVEEEIAFGPENLCLSETEILQRTETAMLMTHCQHLRHRHPATLSGGEAQRVVMASALAMKPRILLLDEAFGRLSPQSTEEILTRLSAWAQAESSLVIVFECDATRTRHYSHSLWRLTPDALEAF
ncbi:ABC transporter ATP-binding protein [Trabulsiella odontotermitis]|uniref:ABC transporter ATP-binding protein n=1 Tax=Trabulsiella odontotermitis TaxID=379893 RepID=UPI000675EB20|nr:ABC transporter ATP-binding protein [Trabulsiella odontotermitis]KNC92598.1 cobalt ABC transporter ATP-binding protein [Trabulsiella odontotermitis]